MRNPHANSTPARVSKRRAAQRCRALFCIAFILSTFFAVTCGCTDPSPEHASIQPRLADYRRTTGPMDVAESWWLASEFQRDGDTYLMYAEDRLREVRWFKRERGSLSTLPYDGEVPR